MAGAGSVAQHAAATVVWRRTRRFAAGNRDAVEDRAREHLTGPARSIQRHDVIAVVADDLAHGAIDPVRSLVVVVDVTGQHRPIRSGIAHLVVAGEAAYTATLGRMLKPIVRLVVAVGLYVHARPTFR